MKYRRSIGKPGQVGGGISTIAVKRDVPGRQRIENQEEDIWQIARLRGCAIWGSGFYTERKSILEASNPGYTALSKGEEQQKIEEITPVQV